MKLGVWGEAIAGRHLVQQGLRIRDRNWRVPEGELDLVVQDGETIVFVEVKARAGRAFGAPEEGVTPTKRRRIQRAAWAYLEAAGLLDAPWRIDVIAIDQGPKGDVERLEHYVNAVDADPLP